MASSAQAGSITLLARPSQLGVGAFLRFVVIAGALNSLIAAFLLCRLPPAHAPSLAPLFVRAVIYVFIGALAGTAGSWFYWRRSFAPSAPGFPFSFRLFALTCASAWVWTPAIILFSRQDSPATPALSALSAAILAIALRKIIPASSLHQPSFTAPSEPRELFAETLRIAPQEADGYIIAICIYIASYALIKGWPLDAGAPFALAAFLFAWKSTLDPRDDSKAMQQTARASIRLARISLAAVLVTLIALLFGVARRNHALAIQAASDRANSGDTRGKTHNSAGGLSGYESIILWPVPEKKQIVAPLPANLSLLAKAKNQPLVIRFNGAYWYFQPPDTRPGPRALQAHGTPLAATIRSNNSLPLYMEAHQSLAAPIPLARCREIQVAIENRGNAAGPIALAVLLADSTAPQKSALYLGQQPLVSSEPGQSAVQSSPTSELLRFFIPADANRRNFDQITVMFFPEMGYFQKGPQIAIDQFNVIPR
ncbi:MAG: hypothetical protein WBE38_13675 [Terracidiphilus sp.]